MSRTESGDGFERVASTDEAAEESPTVVRAGGRSMALFHHEGEFHAVDNRCPHMGFPLTEGTVDDGVLTCHWHHARFELSCGDTFDPFADDVQTFPVEVRDGEVYVDPDPEPEAPPAEHWRDRLEHGLRENLPLVLAKSAIGLDEAGVPAAEAVRAGARFGASHGADGWGRGLTTLGVMANLLDHVRPEDRRRAVYAGLTEVADAAAGEPPFYAQEPLSTDDVDADRLEGWFRENVEVRDAEGAQRVLRAAVRAGLPESTIARMLFAAATDHLSLNAGHTLDFVNKAFETLDRVGYEHADDLLPSLVPGLANASRAEEQSTWRQPIDLAALLFDAYEDLPELAAGAEAGTWTEPDGFVDTLLDEDPHAIVDALVDAVADGATATELAAVVAYAAALRVARFGTSNDFGDWDTVHHTYTYANAVHAATLRTDAWELYRGVFDAAMNVYQDRFLNVPPTPVPDSDEPSADPDALLDDLLETFEYEGDRSVVDESAELTADYLAAGGDVDRLKRALGRALLREDAGFHTRQNVEAAFAQYGRTDDPERGRVHLVATARYLSAHTPTRRSGEQTFRIADRLNRGEKLHEGADGGE